MFKLLFDVKINLFICFICIDCTQVKSSGMYLIAPGGKYPLFVHCDISDGMSWITVQKRTNDGLKFNNNWKQYAKGFGSLYGKQKKKEKISSTATGISLCKRVKIPKRTILLLLQSAQYLRGCV